MIVLTAIYTVSPHDMSGVLTNLAEMTRLVHENEPGCVTYRVHQSADRNDQLLLYEAYRDQESFDAHTASPYFQEIVIRRIIPILINRERTLWRLVELSDE